MFVFAYKQQMNNCRTGQLDPLHPTLCTILHSYQIKQMEMWRQCTLCYPLHAIKLSTPPAVLTQLQKTISEAQLFLGVEHVVQDCVLWALCLLHRIGWLHWQCSAVVHCARLCSFYGEHCAAVTCIGLSDCSSQVGDRKAKEVAATGNLHYIAQRSLLRTNFSWRVMMIPMMLLMLMMMIQRLWGRQGSSSSVWQTFAFTVTKGGRRLHTGDDHDDASGSSFVMLVITVMKEALQHYLCLQYSQR